MAVEINVRTLQAKDLFTLARIVHNSRGDVEAVIRDVRKPVKLHKLGEVPEDAPAEPELDWTQVGTTIIFSLLGQAEREIKPWLADMARVTPKQFDELGMGQVVDLIEGVVTQEDWPGFLGRLSAIFTSSMQRAT